MSPKQDGGSGKTSTNNLVALGSIAVLGVYAAGYARTAAAADRFAQAAQRHPAAVIARSDKASPTPVEPSSASAPSASAPSASTPTMSPVAGVTPAPTTTAAATSPASVATAAKVAATIGQPASAVTPTASGKSAAAATGAPAKDSAVAVKPTLPAVPPVRTDPVTAKVVAPPVDSAAIAREAEKQRVVWKDGAYVGYGTSRHGDIEATIEVKGGKIISASISDCRTQYSCSWISALPPQVLARQSAEVDYVSGATQSSNAFYAAIVDALSKAK